MCIEDVEPWVPPESAQSRECSQRQQQAVPALSDPGYAEESGMEHIDAALPLPAGSGWAKAWSIPTYDGLAGEPGNRDDEACGKPVCHAKHPLADEQADMGLTRVREYGRNDQQAGSGFVAVRLSHSFSVTQTPRHPLDYRATPPPTRRG